MFKFKLENHIYGIKYNWMTKWANNLKEIPKSKLMIIRNTKNIILRRLTRRISPQTTMSTRKLDSIVKYLLAGGLFELQFVPKAKSIMICESTFMLWEEIKWASVGMGRSKKGRELGKKHCHIFIFVFIFYSNFFTNCGS